MRNRRRQAAVVGLGIAASGAVVFGWLLGSTEPASRTFSQASAFTVTENYQPAHGYQTNCLGVDYAPETLFSDDDYLSWNANGTLGPGESYAFTPTLRSCALGENSSIIVTATGGPLQLSTTVPQQGDTRERGKAITSVSGHLCMFMPNRAYSSSTNNLYADPIWNASITMTNIGTSTVSATMTGIHQNGWISLFYDKCMYSDADHDGFNDTTEDALAYSTRDGFYNVNSQSWPYPPAEFRCCMYLASSLGPDPGGDYFQVGFYPPDFNNDGTVDQIDLNRLTAYLGQGDGIPLAMLPPDPGNYQGYEQVPLAPFFQIWRRFDIDQDGYVNATDLSIVQRLVGVPIPMPTDLIPPTTRVTRLFGGAGVTYTTTVPRGKALEIDGYAWDNWALTKVEFYVNGNLTCAQTKPNERPYQFSLFSCAWNVPKKPGATYLIHTRAYDGAANITTGPDILVTAQ